MKWTAVWLALILCALLRQTALAQTGTELPKSPWLDPALRTRCEPDLLRHLLAAAPGEHAPVIVKVRPQMAGLAAEQASITSLQAVAATSQAAVAAFLEGEEQAGRVEDVRSFWIFNGLALRGSSETLLALAQRADVALLQLDHYAYRLEPGADTLLNTSPGLGWGVQRVGADRVWTAFNDTGKGVVVANMDTGVDFLHPELNANYRGNAGKGIYMHQGNWFDATSDATSYPYDGFGHGTHTMGTLAGHNGIGVAPGARWIAVRVLDSRGYGYDSWIHAGFQWIVQPGGNPALAPQVLNNSWGSDLSASTEFQNDLALLRHAGIFVVFSAGNRGPDEGSVGSPAALPGAFAVGASDADEEVALFSSRGPSPWGETKPSVVAPGVNIPSIIPGGSYLIESGTSMAAPHVAGIAALMLAINPRLTVTATEYALTSTAVTRSAVCPDNAVGWGRVDAYAAVQAVAGAGTLTGRIVDRASRLPLPGAQVTFFNHETQRSLLATGDGSGSYTVGLAAGYYRAAAAVFGYQPQTIDPVRTITGTVTRQDFALERKSTGVLRGVLVDAVNSRPATVTLSVLGTPISVLAYGRYEFGLPEGSYTVQARGVGYHTVTNTVQILADQVTDQDFMLTPTPRILLVNSGAWYYEDYLGFYRQPLDRLGYAYDELQIKHVPEDIPGERGFLNHDLVIWSAPEDAPGFIGATAAITNFLSAGGNLLLSGQDVAFWDGGGSGEFHEPYIWDYLKTSFVQDNAASRYVAAVPGDIVAPLAFGIAGGDGADNQAYPDTIDVRDADYANAILRYEGDGWAGNKVGLCLPYRSLVIPFGFEGINTAALREDFMARALDYFAAPRQADGLDVALGSAQTKVGPPGTHITFTVRVRNTGEAGKRVAYQVALAPSSWTTTVSPAQFSLSPCAYTLLTVFSRVPANAPVDERDLITLSVRALDQPDLTRVVTMTAKTPAPVLLVDNDRWYDVQPSYLQALRDAHVPHDLWTMSSSGTPKEMQGPSTDRLLWYPAVIWFTGYNWAQPLGRHDETQVTGYLKGGGSLLFSSPFYLDVNPDSTFPRATLGVITHTRGMTATQAYGSPGHPLGVAMGRTDLVNPFPRGGVFTLDGVIEPSASAASVWRGDHDRTVASANSDPGHRLVFWDIPFEALPAARRSDVMPRMLGWLGPLGDSTVQVAPAVLPAKGEVTVTLMIRNRRGPNRASLRASLPAGSLPTLATLPPDLAYDPASNALTFTGDLAANAAVPLTFRLQVAAAGPGRTSGKVTLYDETWGFTYDQPLEVAVGVPDLHASQLRVSSNDTGLGARVEMQIANSGAAGGEESVTGLAPLETEVVAGSASLVGAGTFEEQKDRVVWHGSLESGGSALLTYDITAPLSTEPLSYPVEMLASDNQGGAWEWRSWLTVNPFRLYYPVIGTRRP